MSIELTDEQSKALEHAEGSPPSVTDPRTQRTYVLVSADVFAQLQSLLGSDSDPRHAYPAIDRAFAPGWNDPKMADYDRYEEHRP